MTLTLGRNWELLGEASAHRGVQINVCASEPRRADDEVCQVRRDLGVLERSPFVLRIIERRRDLTECLRQMDKRVAGVRRRVARVVELLLPPDVHFRLQS